MHDDSDPVSCVQGDTAAASEAAEDEGKEPKRAKKGKVMHSLCICGNENCLCSALLRSGLLWSALVCWSAGADLCCLCAGVGCSTPHRCRGRCEDEQQGVQGARVRIGELIGNF